MAILNIDIERFCAKGLRENHSLNHVITLTDFLQSVVQVHQHLVIGNCVPNICQMRAFGYGLPPLREGSDVGGIIILLDMLARAGNGDGIQ